MAGFRRWLARLGAVLGSVGLVLAVPVTAWASDVGALVTDLAQRRPLGISRGIFGLCCVVVVGLIILLVVLLMRGRRPGPPR